MHYSFDLAFEVSDSGFLLWTSSHIYWNLCAKLFKSFSKSSFRRIKLSKYDFFRIWNEVSVQKMYWTSVNISFVFDLVKL